MSLELPLSSVSAKTNFSPPITYWENYPGPGPRVERIWRHIVFYLKLHKSLNGFRFLGLMGLPLPPLGQSNERIQISWCVDTNQVVLGKDGGRASGDRYVDFRLSTQGRTFMGPHLRQQWTSIIESFTVALQPAGAVMDLRVVLEHEADLATLESFFAEPRKESSPSASDSQRRYSDLQVAVEKRPARPQTNPQLDPRVYDPFPGIPVQLGRIVHKSPPKPVSNPPVAAEALHALTVMDLSGGDGAGENHQVKDDGGGAKSDTASARSSPSAWSFLEKSRGQNPRTTGSSSSSASPESPPRRMPVVVKSESESESDVQIVETVKPRSKRLSSTGRGGKKSREVTVKEGRVKEKKKKKHKDDEQVDEEAEAERKRKKRERKRGRRNKYIDNDGDIEMESDADSMPMKKKKKTKTRKSKEKQPPSDPESDYAPPTRKPSRSRSESRRSSKRKFPDSDNGHSDDEVDGEELSAQRESLKKRITEISMAKHELRVEEEELKAKLHRLDLTFRKHHTENEGGFRANCICSACGKYGHKKSSITCELHPEAISVAAWRARGR